VSESSLDHDRGEKAVLYAEAGIADYWVIDIPARRVEVHRDPREGRYHSVQVFRGDDELRPLPFPGLALCPAMLWAEA
jgi:Uma2 family endonuclease